jgi:hypothetical protein
MWFGPPEHNTLRPQENESCIVVCCFSVCLDLNGLADSSACMAFYSSRPQQVQCDPVPDRWPQGGWIPAY